MERPAETTEIRLSDKQQAFVDAYVGPAHWNASEAARIAGYAIPHQSGFDCMGTEAVKLAIKQRTAATAMHADELLMRLGHEARGIGKYLRTVKEEKWIGSFENGKLIEVDVVRPDLAAMERDDMMYLIKETADTAHGQAIKFIDPLAAQAILVKVHNLDTGQRENNEALNAIADSIKARAIAECVKMGFTAGVVASGTGGIGSLPVSPLPVSGTTDVVIETVSIDHDALIDGEVSADVSRVGVTADHATSDATMSGETRVDATDTVTASLGTCVICGDLPASKVTRGGGHVCAACVPG